MKKRLLVLLCFIMVFSMTACGKKADSREETSSLTESVEGTSEKATPEGEKLMEIICGPDPLSIVRMAGSEEDLNQLAQKYTETYTVYSSGDVCMNDSIARLKPEDLDTIQQYYERFCVGNVTVDTSLITDLPTTVLNIFKGDQIQEYEWSSTRRFKEIIEVKAIVSPYFEHVSMWTVVPYTE